MIRTETKRIKPNTTIKVDSLTAAARFMNWAKENGAVEIRDAETRKDGGRKYDMNGEVIYICMN